MAFSERREHLPFRSRVEMVDRPPDSASAGQFSFVILGGQLRIVCPDCHEPIDCGGTLGRAWSAAKAHIGAGHRGFQ